jgi:alginate O-acetyltransferase complex protein AlgI
MVFSSNLFLYIFLPLVIILHTVSPKALRNAFLLLASLAFYSWGSGPIVLLLLCSIVGNYLAGRAIASSQNWRKQLFVGTTVLNLTLLIYYKYSVFLYHELGRILSLVAVELPPIGEIPLPIGISFFTFQAISYLGEVYRREHSPAQSIVDYGMYITLFPHLIAGPIVRFSEISHEIRERKVDLDGMYEGLWRFSLGLGKKVIIANSIGTVADKIFALPSTELTTATAWTGALCYTFQIYFDFSGYSDMAIGLARMFGFYFPENFNQPYRASTVTEFWRRWHMSLSRWFRDFVYIPLGGNRHGSLRTAFNLWIVFFLCGLWHGAAWTFVIWGVYHGVLLVIERLLRNNLGFESKGILGNALTMLLVVIGWVFFRADGLPQAWAFLGHMFSLTTDSQGSAAGVGFYLQSAPLFMLIAAALFSWLPVEKGQSINFNTFAWTLGRSCVIIALMLLSSAILATSAFNPFIYFRF